MKSEAAVTTLSALAQGARLAIFRALVKAGPKGVAAGDIAAKLKVAASTLSFHLKELEGAGLITQRREGRSIIYTARYETMRALLAYLMEDCCGGKPEMCDSKLESCC